MYIMVLVSDQLCCRDFLIVLSQYSRQMSLRLASDLVCNRLRARHYSYIIEKKKVRKGFFHSIASGEIKQRALAWIMLFYSTIAIALYFVEMFSI